MTINERLQKTIENLELQGYVMSDDIEHLTNILNQLKLGFVGSYKYEEISANRETVFAKAKLAIKEALKAEINEKKRDFQ